jgi:hypothetical protein
VAEYAVMEYLGDASQVIMDTVLSQPVTLEHREVISKRSAIGADDAEK